jgi:acetoin utilization deacetylase AcuC-like enzyme
MVTAAVLRQEGLVGKVGIIDCDTHPGDGTQDIISRLGAASWVRHFTAGEDFDRPDQVPAFFERLGREMAAMADCDVVLYQAGADSHINDCGWMTTDQMRLRDALVFEGLHRRGIPVVWNLAGGYQTEADGSIPKVLAIHANTARECIRVFGQEG